MLAAVLTAPSANAIVWDIDWTWLSDPNPTGPYYDRVPGADLLFGTSDDLVITDSNPAGHSTYSTSFTPGLESSAGGTFTTLFEWDTSQTLYTSLNLNGTAFCAAGVCAPNELSFPFTNTLTTWPGPAPAASSNSALTNPDQSFIYEFDVRNPNNTADPFDDDVYRATGTGWLLQAGQDPAAPPPGVSYTPEVVAAFQASLSSSALPANWLTLAIAQHAYQVIDGPSLGGAFSTGQTTAVAYFTASDYEDGPGSRFFGQVFDEGTTFIRTIIGDEGEGSGYYYNGVADSLDNTYIGRSEGGSGSLTLLGGSQLTFNGGVVAGEQGDDVHESVSYVGLAGRGRLDISEGSTVDGIRFLGVGTRSTAHGEVTIDGAGSRLTLEGYVADNYCNQFGACSGLGVQGAISIGSGGTGIVRVQDGGLLEINEVAAPLNNGLGISIGGSDGITAGGDGTLIVDGTASLVRVTAASGGMFVGGTGPDLNNPGTDLSGSGTVMVQNGGRMEFVHTGASTSTTFGVTIGYGGNGYVSIDGSGSAISMSGEAAPLFIGAPQDYVGPLQGTGTVEVINGGLLEVGSSSNPFTNYIAIGALTGSTGTLRVDGSGSSAIAPYISLSTNFTLNDFGQDPIDALPDIPPGAATLIVANGGQVLTTAGVFIGNGGTLSGNGTVGGGVFTAPGGTVAPGLSPGDLTIDGVLDMSLGGILSLEINELATFDRVIAGGYAFSEQTTIEFLFADGLDPTTLESLEIGDFLRIGDENSSVAADLLADLPGLDLVNFTAFSNSYPLITLNVGAGGGFEVTAVPLPAAIWMLAPALALLLRARGSRRV
ncbi:MAG: hypothetical protein WD928_13935 [Gammaproteobacteria bacterium]